MTQQLISAIELNDELSRVLVIDDSKTELKLIKRYIKAFGYITEQAASGPEALEILNKDSAFDLVILDIIMPGMTGFEVCAELRKKYSMYELPVLFLTSLHEVKDIVEGFQAGGNDFLTKPYNSNELLARAKNLIKLKKLTQANNALQEAIYIKNKSLLDLENEIAERKKIEKQLIVAKENADAANRFKSEFIANMSHEIRTPLNAILGFSDLLKNRLSDEKSKDYADAIMVSSNNLLTLINDILDISKIEAGKIHFEYESVVLKQILKEIKQVFFHKMAEKKLDLKIEIDSDLPEAIVIDEARLRQILVNLVGNAVKFTEKGSITIKCYAENIDYLAHKLNLFFEVIDTGIGIPQSQIDAIFEAFRQVDGQSIKAYGGTGLGLTITKRLIEMMNGTINVRSKVGEGSAFCFNFHSIKFEDFVEEKNEQVQIDVNSIIFLPAKLLLVDDIANNRRLIIEYLSNSQLEIETAESGKEALEKAAVFKPDLILMDLKMPVMDGHEAVKNIRKSNDLKDIKVVALTASVMKDEIERIWQNKFDGFVPKPVNKLELFEEMMKHLKYKQIDISTAEIQSEAFQESTTELETNITDVEEMLRIIDLELIPLHKRIEETFRFGMIRDFAKRTAELGKKHNAARLALFCETLQKYSEAFDLKKVKEIIKDFDIIVDNYKK